MVGPVDFDLKRNVPISPQYQYGFSGQKRRWLNEADDTFGPPVPPLTDTTLQAIRRRLTPQFVAEWYEKLYYDRRQGVQRQVKTMTGLDQLKSILIKPSNPAEGKRLYRALVKKRMLDLATDTIEVMMANLIKIKGQPRAFAKDPLARIIWSGVQGMMADRPDAFLPELLLAAHRYHQDAGHRLCQIVQDPDQMHEDPDFFPKGLPKKKS